MGLRSVAVPLRAGVSFDEDPVESPCVIAHNVDFDTPHGLSTRGALSVSSTRNLQLVGLPADIQIGGAESLCVLDRPTSGTVTVTLRTEDAAGTDSTHQLRAGVGGLDRACMATFTAAAGNYLYASGQCSPPDSRLIRWVGSTPAVFTLAVPAALGSFGITSMCQTPVSGRMAYVGYQDNSRVFFSSPYDAETVNVLDYVELNVGSNGIVELVAFDNALYALSRDRAFCFYAESVDATGGAEFLWQEIDYGGRRFVSEDGSFRQAVTGPDGVYCRMDDGLARITRAGVQMIPGATKLFASWGTSVNLGFGALAFTSFAPGWHTFLAAGEEVFVCCNKTTIISPGITVAYNARTGRLRTVDGPGENANQAIYPYPYVLPETKGLQALVYDSAGGGGYRPYRWGSAGDAYGDGVGVGADQAIECLYATGMLELGGPGIQAVVRQVELEGQGRLQYRWRVDGDHGDTEPWRTVEGDTGGVTGAIKRRRDVYARRGRRHQLMLRRDPSTPDGTLFSVASVTALAEAPRLPVERSTQ